MLKIAQAKSLAHVLKPPPHLTSTLHTLQRSGLGEHKLHGLVADLEVRLLLRIFLHELREAGAFHALEGLQLTVLVFNGSKLS